jgi:hypothetical protein
MNQYGSPPRIHTWPKTNLYGYLRYINKDWFDMATEAQLRKIIKEELKLANPWAYKNVRLEKEDAYGILRKIRDAVVPKK